MAANVGSYTPGTAGDHQAAERVTVHLTLIGATVALLTFFMPWVSCQNVTATGADIARASSNPTEAAVGAVPLIALLVIALAFGRYTSQRASSHLAFYQAVLSAIGTLIGIGVIAEVFRLRQDPRLLGFGQLVNLQLGVVLETIAFAVTATIAFLDRE